MDLNNYRSKINFNFLTSIDQQSISNATKNFAQSVSKWKIPCQNNARGWKNIYARGTLADRIASCRNLIQEHNVSLERFSSIRLRENGEVLHREWANKMSDGNNKLNSH